MQTIWEELPQELVNKAVANFTKRLTAHVAANLITSSICSDSVHLQVYILIAAPKLAFFRPTHILPEKTTFETLQTTN